MRTGKAWVGTTFASIFTDAANAAYSKKTDFLTPETLFSAVVSAGMGRFSDWTRNSDLDVVTLWAVGAGADLISTMFTSVPAPEP